MTIDNTAKEFRVYWVRNLDEPFYNGMSPHGRVQDAGYYGMTDGTRESMYSFLQECAEKLRGIVMPPSWNVPVTSNKANGGGIPRLSRVLGHSRL